MTTIAANREGMASDSWVGDGNPASKIIRGSGILIGVAGDLYYGTLLARWVVEGERGMAPPWDESYKMDDDDKASDTTILILRKSGLFTMDGRCIVIQCTRDFAAIGSGSEAALGAMVLGHSPQEAVEAAVQVDASSKGPVVYESLAQSRRAKGSK